MNCTYPAPNSQAITAISQSGTTVTVTVASTTNFPVGNYVNIYGVTDTSFNQGVAGAVQILTVDSTHITYAVVGSRTASSSGGSLVPAAWYTEKISTRWWLCTPLGHGMFTQNVSNITLDTSIPNQGVSYATIVAAKYPNLNVWGDQVITRMKSWGFNTVGDDAATYVYPFGRTGSGPLLPMTPLVNMSFYALSNTGSYSPQATKGLEDCLIGSSYTGNSPGGGPPDAYDPNYDTFVTARWVGTLANSFYKYWLLSPWIIGIEEDESDQLYGISGPGLEIPGIDGEINPHIGWMSLACKPTMSTSARWSQTFADTTVYSKAAVISYLTAQYGTIGALNTAWGSTYTTLGSSGGWPKHTTGGTGLQDEDGSSAWLGSTAGTLSGANATAVIDLDAFLLLWATKYFKTHHDAIKAVGPYKLVISSSVNSHAGLTRKQVLQGAGLYSDIIQGGFISNTPTASQLLLDKTALYAGDMPIQHWLGDYANPDSSLYRYSGCFILGCLLTQTARGAVYQSRVSQVVNATVTATGSHPYVGFLWWSWLDGWNEKANWGLVSFRDNAYNGQEAIIAAGVDPWGYTTGGEEHNYGDFVTSVTAANAYWLGVPQSQGPKAGHGIGKGGVKLK